MNFDEAFDRVKAGTASEEDKVFVEKELENLRKIRAILDDPMPEPVVSGAEEDVILRARKSFNRKTTLKVVQIVFCCLLAIAMLVCGIIFIPACTSAAGKQNISEEKAIELAKQYLSDMDIDTTALTIRDVDRELRIPSGLSNAIYVYEIEFRDRFSEYTLEVSTKSGYVILTDIDYD